MKPFKRISALLLTLILIFSMVTPVSAADSKGDVWDGTIAEGFSEGSGTVEDPYLISTGAELAYMAQQVNASNSTTNPYRNAVYKLTADIDLNAIEWTPIGQGSNYFCGTFIGGGHTIKNLKISGSASNVGLFGNIAGAKICDMTIADSSITSSGYYVGAFAGTAGASSGVALCNLHVVNTEVSGKYAVGGILGFANVGSSNSMSLCCSSILGGSVSGTQYAVGGLIGWVYRSVVTINRSCCEAESITSSTYGGAGGLVGIAADITGSTKSQVNIKDGYNTANITVGMPVNYNSYYNAAGGIVGYSKTAYSTVEHCYNTGTITAGKSSSTSIKSYAAGICGYSIGGAYTNCFQAGFVATTNTSTTAAYKPTLSGIRVNSGTVTDCYYKSDCFTSNTSYFTRSSSGTEIADKAAIITKINADSAYTGTGYWKTSENEYPVLTGCVTADGECTCKCGCLCTPSVPDEPEIETWSITYVYNNQIKSVDKVNVGESIPVKDAEICYDGLYDNTEYVKVTGWTDGTNTYAIGAEITPTSDLTLTACTVSVIELCDGETEDVIGIVSEDEYEAGKNGELVNELSYNMASTFEILPGGDAGFSVDGTRKFVQPMEGDEYEESFAGWFYTPYDNQLSYELDWSEANNVGADDLFTSSQIVNHRIYAYWIRTDFLKTTISYRSNDKYAAQVYANSTVPGDIFGNYGFVLSTTAGENDEDKLVIGGRIGSKPVGNFSKTTIYQKFKASPIYNKNYTAQNFNGGLSGFDNNGTGNGYITYFYWKNMQLYDGNGNPTSLAARAYYTTKEGTVVYGDMERVVFAPNTIYPEGK